jgi:hypothetical protein
MTFFYKTGTGTWWKYSRYEINNDIIYPSAGAELTNYEPWDYYEYQTMGRDGENNRPPYLELLDIAMKIKQMVPRHPESMDANLAADITDWCAKWGLLGVLPHQVLSVEFDILPGEQNTVQPGVIPRRWDSRQWQREGVSGVGTDGYCEWSQHFPGIPAEEQNNYHYPLLLSDDFWRIYREPVQKFFDFAVNLYDMKIQLDKCQTEPRISKPIVISKNNDIQLVGRQLEYYLSHVKPVLTMNAETGALASSWHSATLLGTISFMFLLDLTNRGYYVRPCEKPDCGKFFRSTDPRAKYHSTACNNAMKQRRLRERRQEKTSEVKRKKDGKKRQ